ncbi:unnamed protein product [Lepeophtheirus salmonis]|uniref:Metalloendopeptidase n=1 Tax=Lepeophtheirus salmonis TaxID=72036 RepID=A0A7R8GZP0_LEPSM|nr:unnamed protein product [Lepeophtheirus salmonis]CAF2756461.1 unnamed protein product [Lepeophtheirus salmonis]
MRLFNVLSLVLVIFTSLVISDTFDKTIGRNLVKGLATKWPNTTLPYQISPGFTASEVELILSAMKEIQNTTSCLKWVNRTTQAHYIDIITGNEGCYSTFGFNAERKTHKLHIQGTGFTSSCMNKGIILNLMMKVMGFGIESNRPDRDSYVTISWENILDKEKLRFFRYRSVNEALDSVKICDPATMNAFDSCVQESQVDTLGLGYDYESITHFGSHYYSKNQNKTVIPKMRQSKNGVQIGQRTALSSLDVKKIISTYCYSAPAEVCEDNSGFCFIMKLGCWFTAVQNVCRKSCNACNQVLKTASNSK